MTTLTAIKAKNPEALAELLRSVGVKVYGHDDESDNPSVMFTCEDESKAREIANIAVQRGYPVSQLVCIWDYSEGEQQPPNYWIDFAD